MLIELGNPRRISPFADHAPNAPAVTYLNIPDSNHPLEDGSEGDVAHYGVGDDFDAAMIREHLDQVRMDGVTHLPGHEALLSAIHPISGLWTAHGALPPSWVHAPVEDDARAQQLVQQLSEWYQIPVGKPDDVEDTHWTLHGRSLPPGVIPSSMSPKATTLLDGFDAQWLQMFAGAAVAGATGTSTGTGTTSMTDSGAVWGTTKYVGAWVQCGNRVGFILSHTGTVLTIDRWYDPTNMGGAAGSTPGATTAYVILPSGPPAIFMGLTANAAAVSTADHTLTAEITTAGGGLIRKIVVLAHSAGSTTGTHTPVFTANGSDSLPVTIAKKMTGCSIVAASAIGNRYEDLFGTTATLSLSGDQLTLTDTITLS